MFFAAKRVDRFTNGLLRGVNACGTVTKGLTPSGQRACRCAEHLHFLQYRYRYDFEPDGARVRRRSAEVALVSARLRGT